VVTIGEATEKNGVVADMGFVDDAENVGPDGLVEPFVVGKAARIDLVEGGFFPPSGGFGVIECGHFFIQRGYRWICSF